MDQAAAQLLFSEQRIKQYTKPEIKQGLKQLHRESADAVGAGCRRVMVDHAEFALDAVAAAAEKAANPSEEMEQRETNRGNIQIPIA